jgi:hypothetical protein
VIKVPNEGLTVKKVPNRNEGLQQRRQGPDELQRMGDWGTIEALRVIKVPNDG